MDCRISSEVKLCTGNDPVFFPTLFIGLPFGQSPIKKLKAASPVQEKDKTADGSGFPSPSAALLLNVFLFEREWWVITDENGSGKGTKIIFLSEVISPILSPKKHQKLIA